MSDFSDLLTTGFAIAAAQMPAVVTGNGHTVTGVSSPLDTALKRMDQGFDPMADGVVVLTIADAALVNAVDGAPLTVDGVNVRVVTVIKTASDPTREIHVRSAR